MQTTADAFAQECHVLGKLLSQLHDSDWQRPTLFKQWTANDILVHLHFWNRAADLSLHEPTAFEKLYAEVATAMKSTGLRTVENKHIELRGADLLQEWRQYYRRMVDHWATLDPKHRVKWAGPDMSVRSSMTARQMETWAHGQAVFDLLGQQRDESDRLENIVVLGVNTFGWTYKVRDRQPPGPMPHLRLTSPEGNLWTYGDSDTENLIEGSAVGFAQTVTQTRNVADTDLKVTGPIASDWMANAQCFAGAAVPPPAAGARFRETNV